MKTIFPLNLLVSLLALGSVLTLGLAGPGCASSATQASTGEYIDDTVITAKVKSALIANDDIKSLAISVETLKGVVQLSGFVNNADQKMMAAREAGSVQGVIEVRNNLIVK